jgi:elongation factor G
MSLDTASIRNVAIAGHESTGKTTLFERLLFAGGAIAKAETVESGKTVSDFTDEEIQRKMSVHGAMGHLAWQGKKINLIDTPGASDFVGDVILAFRSCELALMLIDARAGAQIETIKLMRNLDGRNKPRAFFISRLDAEHADFAKALADIKDKLKVSAVPITMPMLSGGRLIGVMDALNRKAYLLPVSSDEREAAVEVPPDHQEELAAARARLCEAAAEGDDLLMEKYVQNGDLSDEEIRVGLAEALAENRIVPALAGAAAKNLGLASLLDFLSNIGPSPLSLAPEIVGAASGSTEIRVSPETSLSALVIKTKIDQFSGRLSFVKVFGGRLVPDMDIYNAREKKREKVGKLYLAVGKKLEETNELVAGDIGIVAKVPSLKTNDTILKDEANAYYFHPLRLPSPVHAVAIAAESKKDEDKLAEALLKYTEEDLTFTVAYNHETHETVVRGMGELQVNMILDGVCRQLKLSIQTRVPRVAYRETITQKAAAEYTHKKQTGGHGQFAKVVLELEPLERGSNYEFVNAVFGGSVSKGFIPGIEKGIHQAMQSGVSAGYPVVDVRSRLTDGKEHPVDSSDLAFTLASRGAFKEAMRNAKPIMLEPIMNLTVLVDDAYLGPVMSDLSTKRGKISSEQPIGGGINEIKAKVPWAELLRYAIDLRSITAGTGSYSVEFDHYSPLQGKLAEDVIKASAEFKKEEEASAE